MQNSKINPARFLGPDGPIAEQLEGYEVRPQQVAMSQAIDKAFQDGNCLVVEAGTGIGKSFAYIVAALAEALSGDRNKVVVSTHTISLQEQLILKDIPFIKKASGLDFRAVLVKGRGNYICWKRMQQAIQKGPTLFDDMNCAEILDEMNQWALGTKEGSLSDLDFIPPRAVWDSVNSDPNTCSGKNCSRHDSCFYQTARKRSFGADVLVVNHSLLFSDLALRQQNGKILPDYKYVILDEAHNVEGVASRHFGLRISNAQVTFLLRRLYNPKTNKGILVNKCNNQTIQLIDDVYQANEVFFEEVDRFNETQKLSHGNGRVHGSDVFSNVLSGPFNKLRENLLDVAKDSKDEQEKLEINAYAARCQEFSLGVSQFVSQSLEDMVYWIESRRGRFGLYGVICSAPLDIGPIMQKALFEPHSSVIMTSATISIKGERDKKDHEHHHDSHNNKVDGFEYFVSRIGLTDYHALQLGSPFDYRQQVKVYVESYLPEPRGNQEDDFMGMSVDAIKKYLTQTGGKAFILFTSFYHLNKMARNLEEFCRDNNILLLQQGRSQDRSALLEQFRYDTNSVLLGTDSFWQGVDVQGESLSNVIIYKLPFSVPDHPLLQARLEKIKETGGSPFFEYQVPEAVLKFKQGFGRLIRSQSDSGIVVILDPRVVTKRYGKAFLSALPDCHVEIVRKLD